MVVVNSENPGFTSTVYGPAITVSASLFIASPLIASINTSINVIDFIQVHLTAEEQFLTGAYLK
jgi:hypothetical protein